MKTIIKKHWFWPVICMLLISLLVWFIGPYFAFAEVYPFLSMSNRIIFILAMFALYFLYLAVRWMQKWKKNKALVSEITQQDNVESLKSAESVELKVKFDKAIALFKSKGFNFRELPWYMIIGNPGTGKTTLLANSGLDFPLYNEFENHSLKGVGGTKNCEWWFTKEAVLLDTAGRYTSQDSHVEVDEAGWKSFLQLIKKYREKPISGLMISFSLEDILTQSAAQQNLQLEHIKQRVNEINNHFNTALPVYLIITKCDYLSGFFQFFESLSPQEKEQVLGFTFTKDESGAGLNEQQFNQYYQQLLQSLSKHQWHRMSLERDSSRKALIYNFVQQLAQIQPAISQLFQAMSQDKELASSRLIRGIYFTSGTQQGVPIDSMLANVEQMFSLKSTAKVQWNNDTSSYFIHDLIGKVIIPEAEKWGVNKAYLAKKRTLNKGLIVGSFVLSCLLGALWTYSYHLNKSLLVNNKAELQSLVTEYNGLNTLSLSQSLQTLNALQLQINELQDADNNWFSGFGLGQSSELLESFEASFQRLLMLEVMPTIKSSLENQINKALVAGREVRAAQTYQALKAYLMLFHIDIRQPDFFKQYIENTINQHLNLSEQQAKQLSAHIHYTLEKDLTLAGENESLINSARNFLLSQSLTELYYTEFKRQFLQKNPEMFSMAELATSRWDSVFTTTMDSINTISVMFTPDVFNQIRPLMLQFNTKLNSDNWVLGEGAKNTLDVKTKDLMTTYANDYINSWQTFITSLNINNSGHTDDLVNLYLSASKVDSPIVTLLEKIAQLTLIQNEIKDQVVGKISEKIKSKFKIDPKVANSAEFKINAHFKSLHEMVKPDQKALLIERMGQIFSNLALQLSQDDDIDSEGSKDQNIRTLKAFALKQPAPLNRWLNQLSGTTAKVVVRTEQKQLSQLWQDTVFMQCQSIVSQKYPFNQTSVNDASIAELTLLFADNGELMRFFEQHLAALVNTNRTPWQWHKNVGQQYGFSQNTLAFFEQAKKINRTLFPNDGLNASVNLLFKPLFLQSNAARVDINIGDMRQSYQFGRVQTARISWPEKNPPQGSSVYFYRTDGSEVNIQENGLFSVFRLLSKGEIKPLANDKVNVTFSVGEYKATYEVINEQGEGVLVDDLLSKFNCINRL